MTNDSSKYRYIPPYGDKSPYKVVITKAADNNSYELAVLAKGEKKDPLLAGTIVGGQLKIDAESDRHEMYLPQKPQTEEAKKAMKEVNKAPTPLQNLFQWDVFI